MNNKFKSPKSEGIVDCKRRGLADRNFRGDTEVKIIIAKNIMSLIRLENKILSDNYNYIIRCNETNSFALIDPLFIDDIEHVLRNAQGDVCYIINTHHHVDHIYGNCYFKSKYPHAKIAAFDKNLVDNIDIELKDDVVLELGSLKLRIKHCPGHTEDHICIEYDDVDKGYFIAGDLLFNGGIGNIKNGGDIKKLFITVDGVKDKIHDDCYLCPGHDYFLKNWVFSKYVMAERHELFDFYVKYSIKHSSNQLMTIGEEKNYNPFFNLENKELKNKVEDICKKSISSKFELFKALRELRDDF
ncbi:MBL fold metallo-hydrolase [Neptuniibacter sp. CAU 1671]|uniref:MBL fold metallo-hydrolase n=1 Tax=Neptuniibacter sp. CAU 1671 TaxID=3032593 RepID=UPI0023DB7C49|nr:MBL fold metallo-hydrolase [Neptuniibacter sp. CAU 1671]MDF2180573.1 MBL fold metallo-hydrolase [Neptuniibacter sp. CAU 1671]